VSCTASAGLFGEHPAEPRLVGIARMAAASQPLESKRRVEYLEIEARTFIGKCSNPAMPFVWTINPYRGCEFACRYCYARYTHEFMEMRDPQLFETRIFAKQFSPEAFRADLARVRPRQSVWIGTATDPYQPAERRFRVTRRILEVLAEGHGRSIGITTKSDLVARDADLLRRIASSNSVRVNVTVTTVDEKLARLLEPLAPRPALRLAAVRALTGAGIRCTVLAHPVMPLVNDSEESLDTVCNAAAHAGAASFSAAPLFLKPCSKPVFFEFLDRRFPHLAARYRQRYEHHAYLRGAYPEMLRERVDKLIARYGFTPRGAGETDEWPSGPQLEVFANADSAQGQPRPTGT